ncbi:MAG: hypothetical protein EOO27_18095, partial [Comamonadaceae bacterium]
MKRQVLRQLGAPEETIERYGNEVFDLERDVIRNAAYVFAVSDTDCDFINTVGGRNDCVLAKNGTGVPSVSDIATESWRPILPADPFAVFISSGHLPNAVGFSVVMGPSMAFLPPDRKLVIAGGVTKVIESAKPYRKWAAINNARTMRLGVVDNIGIAALRRFAHVFVLPITAGGGSNIKTAEALLTGAHVLGTPTAFRGYEEYIGEPNVYVEKDPERFRTRLVQLLNGSGRPYDFVLSGDPRGYADLAKPAGLAEISSYAQGIGANTNLMIPLVGGKLGTPTSLVSDAHAAGLIVHGWTFRAENAFLPDEFDSSADPTAIGDLAGQINAFLKLGMDGVF